MKNIIIPNLFLASCIAGCSIPDSGNKETMNLVSSYCMSLPIDDSTYYTSSSIFQFEDEKKEYLSFFNRRPTPKIHIYNLENLQVEKTIWLSQEGSNGMPGLDTAYPFNKNQFVVTSGGGRFWFINGKGEIEKSFNLWENGVNFNVFDHIAFQSYIFSPAIVKDSILYFSQQALKSPRKKEEWSNIPMFAYADLKNGKTGWSQLYFPPIFSEDELFYKRYYPLTSYSYTGKELVISLFDTDSILISSDFKNKKWHNAKSRYFPHIYPIPRNLNQELDKMVRELGRRPQYLHLIYDKYRDVFYRFALMPIENMQPFGENPEQEFSIIILNHKYEIIGETRFPGNTYDFYMCFVGKKGLYISENNINNPNFDENKLVFRCFTLEEAATD